MKNGKSPNRTQKAIITKAGLKAFDWLVSKHTPEEMFLVHRYSNKTTKTIYL